MTFTDSCITSLSAAFKHFCNFAPPTTAYRVCLHKFEYFQTYRDEQAPEGFQTSFFEEVIEEYIFGVRQVAAGLLLLMEKLMKGSSLETLLYFFWHFSLQSRTPLSMSSLLSNVH